MYAYLALAALQVVGGFQSADITRQNGDLQNKIADMNSKFAEYDAFNARATGQTNAAKYAEQVQQTQSADKAAYASEGVDVNYGTAKNVESDNKVAAITNTLQIQKAAQNQAVGFENQAINIRLGGQMKVLQAGLDASAQESSGIMKGISTGVSGYAYDNSTGKGNSSRTGTDSTPKWNNQSSMWVTPDGQQISGAASLRYQANTNGGSPGWYPDSGSNGSPGFYGYGPRGNSFTDEAS